MNRGKEEWNYYSNISERIGKGNESNIGRKEKTRKKKKQ